jgi:hypothetical protein
MRVLTLTPNERPFRKSDRITAEFGDLRADAAEILPSLVSRPSLIEGIPTDPAKASIIRTTLEPAALIHSGTVGKRAVGPR